MKTLLTQRIRASYPGIVLITHEETRAIDLLKQIAAELNRPLVLWNCLSGMQTLTDTGATLNQPCEDPIPALETVPDRMPSPGLLLLQDMNLYLDNPPPLLIRQLKYALQAAKTRQITVVMTMPAPKLPVDLDKAFSIMQLEMPDRDTLHGVLDMICHQLDDNGQLVRHRPTPTGNELDAILDAAAGLTCAEAEDAFALSLTVHSNFVPATILREKTATIKKNGLCEYLEPTHNLADVGGFDAFKAHIRTIRNSFTKEAREYARGGPVSTKGELICGQPGTGKTLVARILGAALNIPVISVRLDALKGSLVGQTEQNWRSVYSMIKGIGNCIAHLDEPDGLFSAHDGGGGDSGTTLTLIKAIMMDIQESTNTYWMVTANDIDKLPDALVSRLNVWYAELPNDTERGEIFQIKMRHNGRDVKDVCPKGLMNVVKATDGFSGRQIEQVWLKAMAIARDDNYREPQEKDILEALKGEIPTSKTMESEIKARRQRLEGKAKPVTSPTMKTLLTSRKVQAAG